MEAEDRPEFLEVLLGVLFDPMCGSHERIYVRVCGIKEKGLLDCFPRHDHRPPSPMMPQMADRDGVMALRMVKVELVEASEGKRGVTVSIYRARRNRCVCRRSVASCDHASGMKGQHTRGPQLTLPFHPDGIFSPAPTSPRP